MSLPSLDKYWFQARLAPAILTILPVVVAVALLLPANLTVSLPIAGVVGLALAFAVSDLARRLGRGAEARLYRRWGGKPSTHLLRHSDSAIDAATKARYRGFLAAQVGASFPSVDDEQADPAGCDGYYESCGTWLRENTRDSAAFPVLFNELITYGFRRNLFALKWVALGLDALILIGCAVAFSKGTPFDLQDVAGGKYMAVSAVALLHALYFSFLVTANGVKDAGRTYARQLILCCDKFIGQKPVRAAAKRKATV